MDSSHTYLAAATIAIGTDYFKTTLGGRPDIRIECLTWVILYIGLNLRRRVREPQAQPEHEVLSAKRDPELNRLAWAASLVIATAITVATQYDTVKTLPLVVVATGLALSYRNSRSAALPKPGSSTASPRAKSQLYDVQMGMLGLLGIYSLLRSFDLVNGLSIFLLILFILARSSGFFLLGICNDLGQHILFPKTIEAVVPRVSLILLVVSLINPPSSVLAWSMVLQAFCTALGLVATFYLILSGHTLAATTLRSYSLAAIQSSIASTLQESLLMSLISILSVTFGCTNLPASTTRRRTLAILIIPILFIFTWQASTWSPSQLYLVDLDSSVHPITYLATEANAKFQAMLNSQSRTVRAAYAEYERRYGRKPPLHFDKWFRAAQKDGFILVDEFDSMMANLEPLWGVAPSDIRARLENVIAASNGEGMYRFTVTRGSKPEFQDPADWMGGVFGNFLDDEVLQTLPELTLAMNTMDEPKVVVPHDILSNALRTAANTLSDPPPGRNPAITQNVDFLSMGKQNTWDAISLSCPPDSMARDFSAKAAQTPFLTDMGFLSNVTLSKDVCQFPELYSMHAGLRHPESMTITHALVPVFSQAKASCFNDLLYPSPFYAEKLRTGEYKESQDPDWGEKENIVYWTGSNTGGHSTSENWRDLQRQRLGLLILDKNRPVNLLSQIQQPNARKEWVSINSTIAAIANLTRIRISAAIQCDYMACQEQNEELEINPDVRDSITDGYHARYNIDLDGNGLSGRFYRLMMSKSAVLKQTLYQEWHDDYLIPWVHYIPLSFDLRDFPEIVRFLTEEPEGQTLGRNVAQQSYDWSRRALRLKDMRIFWWRLMLEYGRLVNDDRDQRTSK